MVSEKREAHLLKSWVWLSHKKPDYNGIPRDLNFFSFHRSFSLMKNLIITECQGTWTFLPLTEISVQWRTWL